ncbi:MAG: hypothetical protein KAG98_00225 [Lentisphaeria bacterium]|nr:hypothetical protein [Lentisphaeria bacterium]
MIVLRMCLLFGFVLMTGCIKIYETKTDPQLENMDFFAGKKVKVEGFEYQYTSDSEYNTGGGVNLYDGQQNIRYGRERHNIDTRMFGYVSRLFEDKGMSVSDEDYDYIVQGFIPMREYNTIARYYCLELPLRILSLTMYSSQMGYSIVEIRLYDKEGNFIKEFTAQKETIYQTIGIPFHRAWHYPYEGYPVALESATMSALNKCLDKALIEMKTYKWPETTK